jgi:hypothetical protein
LKLFLTNKITPRSSWTDGTNFIYICTRLNLCFQYYAYLRHSQYRSCKNCKYVK